MSTILPVPSTRVSDLTVNQRLVSQLESDQTDLVDLETEISSGSALSLAQRQSGRRPARLATQASDRAEHAIPNERHGQSGVLATTDSTLSSMFSAINNIKSVALVRLGHHRDRLHQTAGGRQQVGPDRLRN